MLGEYNLKDAQVSSVSITVLMVPAIKVNIVDEKAAILQANEQVLQIDQLESPNSVRREGSRRCIGRVEGVQRRQVKGAQNLDGGAIFSEKNVLAVSGRLQNGPVLSVDGNFNALDKVSFQVVGKEVSTATRSVADCRIRARA